VDLHCDAKEKCHTCLDLAAACWSFAYADIHVPFFVFAEAWPHFDHPLLKGKGSNNSLTIHPGKVDRHSFKYKIPRRVPTIHHRSWRMKRRLISLCTLQAQRHTLANNRLESHSI